MIRSSSSSAIAASLLAGVRVGPDVREYADVIGSADDAADHRRQRLQRADAMDVVGLSGDVSRVIGTMYEDARNVGLVEANPFSNLRLPVTEKAPGDQPADDRRVPGAARGLLDARRLRGRVPGDGRSSPAGPASARASCSR